MNIRPIQKKILIDPTTPDEVSKGGIFLPQTAQEARGVTSGRIVAMAEDVDTRRFKFKIGMIIIFNKFSYTEIKQPPQEAGGKEKIYLLIDESKVEACIDS